jgi:hypothetical protein
MAKASSKKAAAPKADAAPAANMGAGADEQNAKQAKAAPSHGDRLDKLEADHAALLDVARANGWSLPE